MSVNIPLGRYKLRSDKANWIVSESKVFESGARKGEAYEAGEQFYSTIASALQGLIERGLRDSDAKSVEELRSDLRRLRSLALKAFEV